MALPDIFSNEITDQLMSRIHTLKADTPSKWGKMRVDQMLAHCSVSYEMALEDKHKKPSAFARFMLKMFIKNAVVSEKPYNHNLRTAPAFMIADERNFESEKKRLIEYLQKTQALGRSHFEGKESLSFGALTANEWNNLFYKHLDHHLKQFGV
ncbi:MAG: DUF1569 domain-containing protein [Crocinitomicaceae bacterium]|nr:DUF1569 domain-containing protein [Crocinitomicaceae bacterium]MBK8926731.1 DUF1569 domain-containing protein [Crocinitomicaceae bacterium]